LLNTYDYPAKKKEKNDEEQRELNLRHFLQWPSVSAGGINGDGHPDPESGQCNTTAGFLLIVTARAGWFSLHPCSKRR
jgi:hypothetical protein